MNFQGEIKFKSSIEEVSRALKAARCCVIIGLPGTGKSTLLSQIRESFSRFTPTICEIFFDDKTTYDAAIRDLYRNISGQTIDGDTSAHILGLKDVARKFRGLILIDNIHQVERSEEILSLLALAGGGASIVISSNRQIDLGLKAQSQVINVFHRGMLESEAVELARSVGCEAAPNLVSTLWRRSDGNPLLLKAIFQKIGNSNLSEDEIDRWFETFQNDYYQESWAKLSKPAQEGLKEVCLIKFRRELISSKLRQLSSEELKELFADGWLDDHSGLYTIRHKPVEFLKSILESDEVNTYLLRKVEASSGDRLEEKLERLDSFSQLGKIDQQIPLLNDCTELAMKEGFGRDVVSYFPDDLSEIDPAVVRLYCTAIRGQGQLDKALAIAKTFVDRAGDEVGKYAPIIYWYASECMNAGNRTLGLRLIEAITGDVETALEFRVRGLCEYANWKATEDLQVSIESLEKAKELLASSSEEGSPLNVLVCWADAVIHERLRNYSKPVSAMREACRLDRLHSNAWDLSFDSMLLSYFLVYNGDFDTAKSVFYESVELNETVRGAGQGPLKILKVFNCSLDGQVVRSLEAADDVIRSETRERLSYSYLEYYYHILQALVFSGSWESIDRFSSFVQKRADFSKVVAVVDVFIDFKKLFDFARAGAYEDLWAAWRASPASDEGKARLAYMMIHMFWANRSWEGLSLVPGSEIESLKNSLHMNTDRALYSISLAILDFVNGRLPKAVARLSDVKKIVKLDAAPGWNARVRALELLVDFKRGDVDKVQAEAEALLKNPTEVSTDLGLLLSVVASVYNHYGWKSKIKKLLEPHGALGEAIGAALNVSKPKSVSKMNIQFWESILSLSGSVSGRVVLESADSKKEFSAREIDKSFFKSMELLLDEREHALHTPKKIFDLRSKALMEDLLKALISHQHQTLSKARLSAIVWKEKYNPLIHDSRIYSMMVAARKILREGGLSEAIVEHGGEYGISGSLNCGCLMLDDGLGEINFRQKWVLKYLRKRSRLSRKEAQLLLRVSAAVLKRDLKDLSERGLIELKGAGRSSYYVLGQ